MSEPYDLEECEVCKDDCASNYFGHSLCRECAADIAKWDIGKLIEHDIEERETTRIELPSVIVEMLGESGIEEILEEALKNDYYDYEVKDILKNSPYFEVAVGIGLGEI